MALIVETGGASATSESYASVTNGDDHFTKFGANTAWSAATTAEKEVALRQGTRYIDVTYHRRWKGRRVEELQALDFPRYEIEDTDGFLLDSDVIPSKLIEATIEAAARYIADNTALFPDEDSERSIVEESSRVEGAVSETVKYAGTKPVKTKFPVIERLLADFLHSSNKIRFA